MSERINDHDKRALALLITQFRGEDRLESLLSTFIEGVQSAEGATFDLKQGRTLDHAVGVQLDRLGEIVGEERQTLVDSTFRSRIRVRILRNLAQGEPERMIRVLGVLTGSRSVQLTEPLPAVVRMVFDGTALGSDSVLVSTMDAVAPAGVRVELINAPVEAFVFAGTEPAFPELPPGGGFSDIRQFEGGGFARIL